MSESVEPKQTLRTRHGLSLISASAISLGATVGAGIFAVTGVAAGLAGSALLLSLLLAAIATFFTALSFIQLIAWKPAEGSIYFYARQLISPLAGFLVGWMWVVSNLFSGAVVALSFAHYLVELTGLSRVQVNLMAVALIIIFTAVNSIGIEESTVINNLLVFLKLGILLIFFVVGLFFIKPENFKPLNLSPPSIVLGAAIIFFAFQGFARVAIVAEEVKNPARNVPRAIIISLAVSTVIYFLVTLVALGLAGPAKLSHSGAPLSLAIRQTGLNWTVPLVSLGGLLATASVLLTAILGISRMLFAMAREKDLPSILTSVHPKFRTPHKGVWASGLIMAILAYFFDLARVVSISSFSLLFYYSLANISALRLEKQAKKYPDAIPCLGLILCLGIGLSLFLTRSSNLAIVLTCLTLGGVVFFLKAKIQQS
ncbi:MAG: APC family permease [Candidatus Saccharicenans sp.]|uniref:APC family permease n=1 Tax=Candidatus Saccharicenans sp. TaxID=2819258 RepID=UPI00404B2670